MQGQGVRIYKDRPHKDHLLRAALKGRKWWRRPSPTPTSAGQAWRGLLRLVFMWKDFTAGVRMVLRVCSLKLGDKKDLGEKQQQGSLDGLC